MAARPSEVTGIFTTMPEWRRAGASLLPPYPARHDSCLSKQNALITNRFLQTRQNFHMDSLLAAIMLGLVVTPAMGICVPDVRLLRR